MRGAVRRRLGQLATSMSSGSCRYNKTMRSTALLLFLAAVFLYSWNSDDAYHSYVMARHLAEGKGLVYNTGYRVSASTCPLLTLIEAFVFLFTDSVDVCGLLIGLLFSGAAAWVLFFRLCPSPLMAFCMLGLMVSSRIFMSFTTSGLENPLLFFFGAVFFDVYHRNAELSKRGLFALSLLMSLLAMTRTDSVLIFIPMAVWAYLARTKVSFPARVLIGVSGLLPFVAWTVFSVIYYGFPFPNTYYAKLYTGIPLADYIVKGLVYYPASWILDLMLLFVPIVAVVFAIKQKQLFFIPAFIGLGSYCIYVVSIGGDFMAGRHLTQQFFLSVCMISILQEGTIKCKVFAEGSCEFLPIALLVAGVCFILNLYIDMNSKMFIVSRGVWDERRYYLSDGGEFPLYEGVWKYVSGHRIAKFRDDKRGAYIIQEHSNGNKGLVYGDSPEMRSKMGIVRVLPGRDIFAVLDRDMYLTDVIALQDPLLARLNVDIPKRWIVGHVVRDVPAGYHETVASGENRIVDKSLHEYYDKLLLVMRGPLFDRERLLTIINFNLGRYDYLLEKYAKSKRQERGVGTYE